MTYVSCKWKWSYISTGKTGCSKRTRLSLIINKAIFSIKFLAAVARTLGPCHRYEAGQGTHVCQKYETLELKLTWDNLRILDATLLSDEKTSALNGCHWGSYLPRMLGRERTSFNEVFSAHLCTDHISGTVNQVDKTLHTSWFLKVDWTALAPNSPVVAGGVCAYWAVAPPLSPGQSITQPNN